MSVRAKFRVIRKCLSPDHNGEVLTVISMSVVTGDSPENKKFFKYTPSGNVEMGVVPQTIADQFELGKEYYLDFTKVE